MLVSDFIKMDKVGLMYKVIDGSIQGYMSNPQVLIEADRNVVSAKYGNCELLGFGSATKKCLTIYVTP